MKYLIKLIICFSILYSPSVFSEIKKNTSIEVEFNEKTYVYSIKIYKKSRRGKELYKSKTLRIKAKSKSEAQKLLGGEMLIYTRDPSFTWEKSLTNVY